MKKNRAPPKKKFDLKGLNPTKIDFQVFTEPLNDVKRKVETKILSLPTQSRLYVPVQSFFKFLMKKKKKKKRKSTKTD